MKRSSLFLSGILIVVLYFLLGNAAIPSNSVTDFSTPPKKETSSLKAVSNTLYCFTEPKGASVNYNPNPVVPVCKTISKFFGGITFEKVTVSEISSLQYHNFLRHFPIPFRALDLLYPSHYFW